MESVDSEQKENMDTGSPQKEQDSFSSRSQREHLKKTYGKDDFDRKNESSHSEDSDHIFVDEKAPESQTSESPERTPEEMQQRIIELETEVDTLREEAASAKDSMLRKAAEFENLKRRTQREKESIFSDANAEAVTRFLPVREDLKRSLESLGASEAEQSIRKGLELILQSFDAILEKYDVEAIEDTGVPFNVDLHDAMLSQPAGDESIAPNTVIQVLEPGYKMGEKVIKHAKVIVSQ
ncbi:nucleotide exchange factor GrpE [Balneolaceae bacterium ANBcel3]|nr:nucleotide exchange factor GrpE [Balneolaceae bacterium ANBcel3]